jgi:hypothetical protein
MQAEQVRLHRLAWLRHDVGCYGVNWKLAVLGQPLKERKLITHFDAACRAVGKDGLIVEITVLRA